MNLAVFASGGGSNFESLCSASDAGTLSASVVLCVTDRTSAGVLDRARQRDIATIVVSPQDHESEASFGSAINDALARAGVDFVVLAGYLKKLPNTVTDRFAGRIVNIHPSLLPAFGGKGMYGKRVHEAVLDYGSRWSGATVHLVDTEYDTGPVVLQEVVPVFPDDSPSVLAARVLEVEHRILPEAVELFATNRVTIDGRRVSILQDESA